MSKIVVIGASGYVGKPVVEELLNRGHDVVAVARDVSGFPAEPRLTAVAGSAYDESFVQDVVQGAHAVVLAIPSIPAGAPELKDVVPTVLKAAESVSARLAVAGGSGSLYSVEGGPLVLDTPEWPAAYLPEAQAHARALAVLRESDTAVDWFYLSPPMGFGAFNPGTRTGSYRVGGDVLLKDANGVPHISAEDFALAIVDEIETPKHHSTRFTVGY